MRVIRCCLLASVWLAGCARTPGVPAISPADSVRIVQEIVDDRAKKDEAFRTEADSPFRRDTSAVFHGLRWYPPDPRFRVSSVLHRYAEPETVIILGTRGEPRKNLRYGFFEFVLPGEENRAVALRLNVYKFTPADAQRYALYRDYLSIWFTDRTSGKETYHVGRYLELGSEDPDPGHLYSLDFNMAFNPYCAYSPLYSCAVPSDKDYLDIALRAGEMNYDH